MLHLKHECKKNGGLKKKNTKWKQKDDDLLALAQLRQVCLYANGVAPPVSL